MAKKRKRSQVVVRMDADLDRKILAAAKTQGLTKAAWARQLFIQTLAQQQQEETDMRN